MTEQALVAGAVLGNLTSRTALALGISENSHSLAQRLSDEQGGSFILARDPGMRSGFDADVGGSIGIRHDFGRAVLTATSEQGNGARSFVENTTPVLK